MTAVQHHIICFCSDQSFFFKLKYKINTMVELNNSANIDLCRNRAGCILLLFAVPFGNGELILLCIVLNPSYKL